jgi:hypothetical protein
MSFQAKKAAVLNRQLKVQKIAIPFAITASATPASKVVVVDEPGILFLQLEGIDNITEAKGAIADDTTLPTMSAESDSSGIFYAAFNLGEDVSKVVSCKLVSRTSAQIVACEILASADGGLVPVVKVDSTTDLSAANLDAVLELEYIV